MPGFDLSTYEPVEDRIRAFWTDHPEGRIETKIVRQDPEGYVLQAKVWVAALDRYPSAMGYAQEAVTERGVNSTSALENCETSAIGRALANLGYGPKGKRPSREEMRKVSAGTTGAAPAAPPQQVVRADSPSPASEPAPAATDPTSETGSIPPRSGGVGSVTSSPEDRSVEDTVAEGASGGITSDGADAIPVLEEGEASRGQTGPSAPSADYREAVQKRGYTAAKVLTKAKSLGMSVSKFDDLAGDDVVYILDELDRAKKGRVA